MIVCTSRDSKVNWQVPLLVWNVAKLFEICCYPFYHLGIPWRVEQCTSTHTDEAGILRNYALWPPGIQNCTSTLVPYIPFSMLTLQGSQAEDTELVIICLFSNLLAIVVTVRQDHL